MKMRNSFVSNSSSTSFVVIRKSLALEDIPSAKHPIWLELEGGYEGEEYFKVDEETLQWCIENPYVLVGQLYENALAVPDMEYKKETLPDTGPGFILEAIEISHHTPSNLNELLVRYDIEK